ncbi:hypothetical protein [Microbacterium amylolyticum]|uniref:Secreted protein n=1 Tax=Microbacterium amylolyticum TaxID=936337 RepID=A0ABS4ZFM7_9MICO|nr:hypothetical protein [Microbacterium amylolyticum]MBP2435795.1 hypothetical protein [Microbacterium amylolyticum]
MDVEQLLPGGELFLPALVGAGVGLVALLAGAIGVAVLWARHRGAPDEREPGGLPPALAEQLSRLQVLRGIYLARERFPAAARVARAIAELTENVTVLFRRLDAHGGDIGRAEHEYAPALARLTAALDTDYLLDILAHPQLWDDRDRRIAEVEDVLAAVTEQAGEHVRTLTSTSAIRVEMGLDGLGARAELRAWEREFRRRNDT